MAITLLDMLMQAGMLTPRQMDDALQHRVFYGGKIGTNLVELGFLHEDDLARFLSRKLGVPYIEPDKLLAIPAEIIALLPRELALKYKAIPLGLEKKRLTLAMADPADLAALDDIAFITGYLVKPLITPEFRLIQALGQYYKMQISPRFQKIIDRRNAEHIGLAPSVSPVAPVVSSPPVAVPPPLSKATVAATAPAQVAPSTPPPPAPVAPGRDLEDGEVVEEGTFAERVERYAVDDLSKAMARVEDRDEIAALLLDYFAREYSCAALFIVRGDVATGWRAYRDGHELGGFDLVHIPFARPSALKTVTEGKSYYLGPLADTPLNIRLIEGLGGMQPDSALIMPLVIFGRVVDLLYLEGKGRDLSSRVTEVQRLLVKASFAFEMLICREKILMM